MRPALLAFFAITLFVVHSCKKDDTNLSNPVPRVTVNYTMDTNLPAYVALKRPGGIVYLQNEGYKGIAVVKDYSDVIYAMDRACPNHPDTTCGRVVLENTGTALVCGSYSGSTFKPCCASRYGLDGSLQAGPSRWPLRQYNVVINDNLITITN